MTNRLHILNQLPEFKSSMGIKNVIQYIDSEYKRIPAEYDTPAKQKRFEEKFGLNSGFDLRKRGNYSRKVTLIYRVNNDNNVELEVVEPEQRMEKIKTIYDDIDKGLGLGLNAFYSQVAMNYLNIPKRMTSEFLRQQGNFQITRPIKKIINEIIIEKAPNKRWAIDIIVMGKDYNKKENGDNEYILTCIDYFSGKCWLRGLSSRANNKETDSIPSAFISICDEADTYPEKLQSDSEFYKGAIKRWCKTKKIKMIKTASYTPTANARVERLNREVRKKLKANFVRTNSLIWFEYLQNFATNINNQKSSVTKLTPNQLWREGHEELEEVDDPLPTNELKTDNYTMAQLYDLHKRRVTNKALRAVASSKGKQYAVGDFVRISLRALFPETREVMKSKMGVSKIGIYFTPEIYRIVQVNKDNNDLKNNTYELTRPSLNGLQGEKDYEIVTSEKGKKPFIRFFGNDLQLVEFEGNKKMKGDDENNNPLTRAVTNIIHSTLEPNNRMRGLYLNRVVKSWEEEDDPDE